MISITRNSSVDSMRKECSRMDIQRLHMSREQLQLAVDRLCSIKYSLKNKKSKHNTEVLEKHLKRTLKKMDAEGTLELCWEYSKGYLESYPISVVDEEDYTVRMSDCIETVGKKLLKIKYSDLCEIMAFKYMYRELGYTLEDIENMMEDIGIVGFYESEKFTEDVKGFGTIFEKDSAMKITNSPYAECNNKYIYGYFKERRYSTEDTTYYEVLNNTCKSVMSIVAVQLMQKGRHNGVKPELVSVGRDYVSLLVEQEDVIDDILDTVVLKVFGRQLILKADVTII